MVTKFKNSRTIASEHQNSKVSRRKASMKSEKLSISDLCTISQNQSGEIKGEATKVQSLLSRKPLMFTGTAKVANLRSLLKMTG